MYTIHQKQKLPISPDRAWDFFSNPGNLKIITPPYMGFIIKSGGGRKMFPGHIIEYSLTPIAGVKTRCVAEITHVIEKEYFVDEQRIDPTHSGITNIFSDLLRVVWKWKTRLITNFPLVRRAGRCMHLL